MARRALNVDWSKYDHLLGSVADGEIANLAGVSRTTIANRRKALKINSFLSQTAGVPPLRWVLMDPEGGIHKFCNLNLWARRSTDLFGIKPDQYRRIVFGFAHVKRSMTGKRPIPVRGYKGWKLLSWKGSRPFRRVDWSQYDHLLGTVSDCALARLIGCAYSVVNRRRRALKIPKFEKTPQRDTGENINVNRPH